MQKAVSSKSIFTWISSSFDYPFGVVSSNPVCWNDGDKIRLEMGKESTQRHRDCWDEIKTLIHEKNWSRPTTQTTQAQGGGPWEVDSALDTLQASYIPQLMQFRSIAYLHRTSHHVKRNACQCTRSFSIASHPQTSRRASPSMWCPLHRQRMKWHNCPS
jgi:hypothetical protein